MVGTCVAAHAAPLGKKFRVSVSAGFFNARDDIPSDSANELNLVDPADLGVLVRQFQDPRNDSSVFGSLDIQSAPLGTISGQYAVNDIFLVEGSAGYQRGDVGDIEVQVQFRGVPVLPEAPFNFATFRIPAGELTRVPIQLTGLARFRPRAKLSPYFGGGLGYSFIGFKPSEEFDQLSINMDNSIGGQTNLSPSFPGTPALQPPPLDQFADLEGATVDARDTFELHVAGGAEFSIKPQWSIFLDMRYTVASRTLSVGFNGSEDLGIAVPRLLDFTTSPVASRSFGAMQISNGGLIDAGIVGDCQAAVGDPARAQGCVPQRTAPANINCALIDAHAQNQQFCQEVFVAGAPDGELDPGLYYVQGGNVDYDGFSYQIGFRYTFK